MTPHRTLAAALALGLALAAQPARATAPAPDLGELRAVLDHAGLLADPVAGPAAPATLGPLRVEHRLRAGAPRLEVTWGAAGADGRPREAVVTVQRWLTGTLEIRAAGARGRDPVVRKRVHDSCVRQVTLRRVATADDPAARRWRVAGVSVLVRATPSGRAMLPLVDLDTHAVSSGFLSLLSDVQELTVQPQTCAVTAPGDSVRVFVGGVDPDAQVCVFAGPQLVTALRRDGSHVEATVRLGGPAGLREIGVTVFPRRTLVDAAAPADTRTWLLPILVGAPPPATQDFFAL